MDDEESDTNHTQRVALFSGAFFLFGLAFLFSVNVFWPWILPLLFLTVIPVLVAKMGWLSLRMLLGQWALWLVGLAVLFSRDAFWPGILVVAGLSTLLVAIAPPDKLGANPKRHSVEQQHKQKRKRELPLPLTEEYEDADPYLSEDEADMPSRRSHHS